MNFDEIKSHSNKKNSKKIKEKTFILKNKIAQRLHSKQINPQQFTKKVLAWFQQHGRKNLPWQHNISPYRVWVSEIMLQQTQVQTVIPYFNRFMQRFPSIVDLANAAEDEVLHLWTGLGYYARARHLHKTAKIIQQQFKGKFPRDLTTIQTLPGIGRSTAGAICAIALKQPASILDGNVKRVLARIHAIKGWPGQLDVAEQLWQIAERYTPQQNTADYTQAMMDIGALICTRTKPQCTVCPLQKLCLAHQNNCISEYPGKKPAKKLPVRAVQVLILCKGNNHVLLMKRPPKGIWGGLWSLPECPTDTDMRKWCQQQYPYQIQQLISWPAFRHTFTHFHLDITPVIARIKNDNATINNVRSASSITTPSTWYNIKKPDERGLAAPIKQLLLQLATFLEEEKYGTNHSLREIA